MVTLIVGHLVRQTRIARLSQLAQPLLGEPKKLQAYLVRAENLENTVFQELSVI